MSENPRYQMIFKRLQEIESAVQSIKMMVKHLRKEEQEALRKPEGGG